jgi:thioredoxin-like negative regulator of GroEL
VNVDDVPGVADQLMVSSIPAVFAFWQREAINR